MTETTCRWDGRERPRILVDRHATDCSGETCGGCLPCTEPHCRVCRKTHADQTCAECMATTRDNLHEIGRLCESLPEEVEHRGVNGEAMMLLGPASDPEARGHLEASVLAGRIPADYLERADGEMHPLFVLGTWDMVWRDALEHEATEALSVATAVSYLDLTMTYMGGYEHVSFQQFAADLRKCRAHLESVLHAGEQRDTGAPCMTCEVPLVRVWADDEHEDGWECPRCHARFTEAQYRLAVMYIHRKEAEWLTDRDCEIRTGVKAGTVRSWARATEDETPPDVRKRRDSGRTLYAVEDVLVIARDKGMVA